jgi:hypothetical protein
MDQSEVSRLEHRSDMLLSTLKRFVHATGGEMHIVVSYPRRWPRRTPRRRRVLIRTASNLEHVLARLTNA